MEDFKKEMEDYFCRFTFGQFVTLILLEIVTLFFVFYLGAHYGPDLLGNRESVAKKDQALLPKASPSNVDEIVGKQPVDYTYPEVLTGPGGDKAIRIKPSGVTAEEYENQKGEEPTPEAVEKSPEVKEAPKQIDKEVNKEVDEGGSKGRYSIQIGSYQSPEEASGMVKKWKGKGYSSFMAVGQIPQKGTWYRVRIGGFSTREEAENFLGKLKTKEKASGIVVLSSS